MNGTSSSLIDFDKFGAYELNGSPLVELVVGTFSVGVERDTLVDVGPSQILGYGGVSVDPVEFFPNNNNLHCLNAVCDLANSATNVVCLRSQYGGNNALCVENASCHNNALCA